MKEILNTSEPRPKLSDDKRLFPDMPQEQEEYLQELAKKSPSLAEAIRKTAKEKLSEPIECRKTSWTIAELYDTEFPEPNWIVPGTIQEGLVVLGGRPKVGKSFLALQIASAVGTGGKVFDRDVVRGKVLYLALEDNGRRLKNRLQKMNIPKNAQVQFETEWRPLHKGGLDDLLVAYEKEKYRLIVIDTLSRALPGVNHNDEQPIGLMMDTLQNIAISNSMTILPVDHTRKPNGYFADPIDDIMGNTAKSKPIDEALAIYKTQGKAGATLRGIGKEIEEFNLSLMFDSLTWCWQSLGDANELALSEQKKELINALKECGKSTAPTINKLLGRDRSNLYKELNDLVNSGLATKEKLGNNYYYEAIE